MRQEGYIQQLADYVRRNLSKGYTPESLKWALVNQGHSKVEVEKAISLANQQLASQAPIMKEKPVIKVQIEPKIPEEKTFWQKIKSWFE